MADLSDDSSRSRVDKWLVAGAVLLAIAGWMFEHRDAPYDLWSGDERHYADVARQLARGEGLTTKVVYPLELQWAGPREHPMLLAQPLWMLSISGAFLVAGPSAGAVHATVLVYFVGLVVVVAALASTLAGPVAGAVAAAAVALSPELRLFAGLGATEIAFAFLTALAFLLLARKHHPLLIGAVCGLAYLTRSNGLLTLGVVAIALLRRPLPWREAGWCALGFGLCVLPLWVHRFLAVGDPFFSYSNALLYFPTRPTGPAKSIYHYLVEPDLGRGPWMDPWTKLRQMLPRLVVASPLASMNVVACIGLALGCVKRDRLALGLLALAAANTVVLAMTIANGRYLVPFLPVLVALAAAMLWRYAGRLRVVALALLVVAPLSPIPPPAPDTKVIRAAIEARRQAAVRGTPDPQGDRYAAMRGCLEPDALVVAENATNVAWYADAIAIYAPVKSPGFWKLVESHDVSWIELPDGHRHVTPQLSERFELRPECGGLYRRRR